MQRRIESQPAYILHTRNFSDSSLIVECLTADYGRVSAVMKGVRANSKSARQRRGSAQPFIPLWISWTGTTELKTITALEPRGALLALQGTVLFSALYVNELLSRLLQAVEEHTDIFILYEWTLKNLLSEPYTDVVLRRFELQLLNYLGFGIDFAVASATEKPIMAECHYTFQPELGFCELDAMVENRAALTSAVYPGADILAIGEGRFNDSSRRAAKRLCRQALQVHLGGKPLKSRELFK